MKYTKEKTGPYHTSFWFFVTFGAVKYAPLSMDYASLFEEINIQCYKMELKKM